MPVNITNIKLRKKPVNEYNTQHQRFANQISNQVFRDLERNQDVLLQAFSELVNQTSLPAMTGQERTVPSFAGQGRTVIAETMQDITVTPVIPLSIEALVINSPSIRFEDVQFTIVGFSSVIVNVSCNIRIGVQYEDVNLQTQIQERVIPFSTTVVIPGNFPSNAVAEGNLILNNLEMTQDIDPSSGRISSMTGLIYVSAAIRIVVPG